MPRASSEPRSGGGGDGEKMPSRPAGAPGGDGGGGGDGTGDGGGPCGGGDGGHKLWRSVRQSPVPFDPFADELDASAHGAYDFPYTPMPGGIGGRIVPACRSGGAFGGDGGMVHRLPTTSGSTPAPSGPGWGGQRRTILAPSTGSQSAGRPRAGVDQQECSVAA